MKNLQVIVGNENCNLSVNGDNLLVCRTNDLSWGNPKIKTDLNKLRIFIGNNPSIHLGSTTYYGIEDDGRLYFHLPPTVLLHYLNAVVNTLLER